METKTIVELQKEIDALDLFMKEHPTEVWSRVVGYFRPVNQWNKGKVGEWKDRLMFDISVDK